MRAAHALPSPLQQETDRPAVLRLYPMIPYVRNEAICPGQCGRLRKDYSKQKNRAVPDTADSRL